jgi:hypothetical protein
VSQFVIPPPTPPPTCPLPPPPGHGSPLPSSPRRPALGHRRVASRNLLRVLSTSSTSSCESSYHSPAATTMPPGLRPASRRTGSNGRDSPFPLGSGFPGAAAAPCVTPGYDSETDLEEEGDVQLHPAYLLFSRSAYVATPARCQSESERATDSADDVDGDVDVDMEGGDADSSVWWAGSDEDGSTSEQETDGHDEPSELDREDARTVRPVDECDRDCDVVRDCTGGRLGLGLGDTDRTAEDCQWPASGSASGTRLPVSYRRCRSCSSDTVTARVIRMRRFQDNEVQTVTVSESSAQIASAGAAGAPAVIVTATTPPGFKQESWTPASELQVEHGSDPLSYSRSHRRHFPGHLRGLSDDSVEDQDQGLLLEHRLWQDDKSYYTARSSFSSFSTIATPIAF